MNVESFLEQDSFHNPVLFLFNAKVRSTQGNAKPLFANLRVLGVLALKFRRKLTTYSCRSNSSEKNVLSISVVIVVSVASAQANVLISGDFESGNTGFILA